MIKKRQTIKMFAASISIMLMSSGCNFVTPKGEFAKMEEQFSTVPQEQQLAVYWYWISDNLSKEGVVKDLQAMKEAGINRAFIGNIGIDDLPYGKVKIFSNEWWDIMHTALKTASELNIEIGIFNSPGWSQSGGPWVKSEESMRYLKPITYRYTGKGIWNTTQDTVPRDNQDVSVIAWEAIDLQSIAHTFGYTHSSKQQLEWQLSKGDTIRSLTIQTFPIPINNAAQLQVKEGNEYRTITSFQINRSNPNPNVGFDPYAPIVISVPPTYGKEFRLIVQGERADGIAEARLSILPRVERYAEKSFAKMFQTPLPMWGDYMWNQQPNKADSALVIHPESVVLLTDSLLADGTLRWTPPTGNWVVQRYRMRTTGVTNGPASPEGIGLEVDKMSREHVSSHFNAFIGEILQRIPEQDRTSFKVVVEDSYETGGQNWTDTMRENFTERYGYDPTPWLPVLQGNVVGTPALSDRFLWDLRRLVADKVAYDYVGGLRDISNQHGLTTWLENYGHWGFPGEFLQYGGQSDEIGGEYWSEGDLGNIENRAASSCGHIYGKQKIWAESFTCAGGPYLRYPHLMKQRGDRFFTEGINATLLHVYIHQPDDKKLPGVNAWFGNEFNRHNTWFRFMPFFGNYLKRCNYMLQQGQYIADVAYFIGEDTPKMTGICDPALPEGYAFDYINAEILLTQARVEEHKLKLNSGMEYSVLVLPKQTTMTPEMAERIREFVENGLTVLGPAPESSPSMAQYPECDQQVQFNATKLWGKISEGRDSAHVGSGVIYRNTPLDTIFAHKQLKPDFEKSQATEPLLFIHRQVIEGDFYFVANQSDETIQATPTFRVPNKAPELWNPLTGETRKLPQYTLCDGRVSVPIELQGLESAFIIFRNKVETSPQPEGNENYPSKELVASIDQPWKVTFEPNRGGPTEVVTFNKLTPWNEHNDPRIKYFSGGATYTTTLHLDKQPSLPTYLDLGNVMVMASVKINGSDAGGVWTYPYRLRVDKLLKVGDNTIEIEVANNWMNRLIGDEALPETERCTQTFVKPGANTPLQTSGLLGPVELICFDY